MAHDSIVSVILCVLAGAFACNAIPHLTAAVQGRAFPTPFASPPARGLSSPLVNILWGTVNLLGAIILAEWRLPSLSAAPALAALTCGFLASGMFLAIHFGRVMNTRADV